MRGFDDAPRPSTTLPGDKHRLRRSHSSE